MKIIKKITAMMLSIMMVLGMCSVVGATGATEKGTITIDNAISGQTYKIYKMLDLESYNKDVEPGLYSYKPANDQWKAFFETGDGKDYVTINKDGYVKWKAEVETTKAAELAQKALAYAAKEGSGITETDTKIAETTTVTFDNLDLGYYLVDSSLGTLCGLNTTNPTVTIEEKNGEPTVEKKINLDRKPTFENLGKENSVNIGEVVTFQTTINVQPGAKNYILHDVMDTNLTFMALQEVVPVENNDEQRELDRNKYYSLDINPTDKCTFELKFTDTFYTEYAEKINNKTLTKIQVRYHAMVKDSAPIKQAMQNKAWLTYGDNSTKSADSTTNTYTYGIPVFKHTGTGENKQALAGAEFELYTDAKCTEANALKFTKNDARKYRYDENGKVTLTSLNNGMIEIEGIKEGIYYLKETKAPKGYNLLKDAIAITIDTNGKITINEREVTQVDVQNNAGSLLPSTGGMGTTIFYIAGALLVLISGVVLIAKKRTDSK